MPGSCDRGRLDELVRSVGPSFERHLRFPRRINLHRVSRPPTGPLLMSTWERGSGATQACGTGACAVVVALQAVEPAAGEWTEISLPGGSLEIAWAGGPEEPVRQRGPAEEVFRGRLETTAGLASRPRSGEDGGANPPAREFDDFERRLIDEIGRPIPAFARISPRWSPCRRVTTIEKD